MLIVRLKDTIPTRSSASYIFLDVKIDGPLQKRLNDKRVDLTFPFDNCPILLPNRMKFTHLNEYATFLYIYTIRTLLTEIC